MRSRVYRVLIAVVLLMAAGSPGWSAARTVQAAEESPTGEAGPRLVMPPAGSAADARVSSAARPSSAYESPNYEFWVNHGKSWAVRDAFSTEDPEGDPFDYLWLWNGTMHAELLGETWAAGTQAPECADFWSQYYAGKETTENFAVLDRAGDGNATYTRLSWTQTREDGSGEPVTMLVGCHALTSGEGAILSMLVSSASADWDADANARYDLFTGICWNSIDGHERCAGG